MPNIQYVTTFNINIDQVKQVFDKNVGGLTILTAKLQATMLFYFEANVTGDLLTGLNQSENRSNLIYNSGTAQVYLK